MALADRYMSEKHLQTYAQDHYQLIAVTCLNIAMKTDSPAKAPSHKELSEICQGAYTPEEIASEELCILQVLAWCLHPPTASQAANHILAIVKESTGAGHDGELLVDQVRQSIDVSIHDLNLSMLRPSTVAMAAIITSAKTLANRDIRQRILRATLSIMNTLDFDSPCEIDSIQTNLYYIMNRNCVLGTTEPLASQGRCHQPTDSLLRTGRFSAVTPQAQTASPPDQSTDQQVHGCHDIEDLVEINRMSHRKRLMNSSGANGSVECLDNDGMEVGDSSCGGYTGKCQPQGPLITSMEESHSVLLSSMDSCSTCLTLETIPETESLQLL